jgi:hypothetical protein
LITITRNQARQLRAVFRRCGIKSKIGLEQRPRFIADSNGLRIRARVMDVAVEYHLPGEFASEEFSLPVDFLKACEGNSDVPVSIESRSRSMVVTSWLDGGVPQQLQYDGNAPPREKEFPKLPEEFVSAGDDLWQGLRDAAATVDSQSIRFALSHMQLRGEQGQIVTTDGRQALVQGGFHFPWSDDLLIPAPSVLGCADLAQYGTPVIGRTEDWVSLRLGPWTILLQINKEGRFPRVEDMLGSARSGPSKLHLACEDAEFLAAALPKLPSNDPYHMDVTLELNGEVLVRAKPEGGGAPTELLLPNCRLTGDPVRIHMDRRFLARALKMGFRELTVTDPSSPVLCDDGRRQYLWALLGPASIIETSPNAIRIQPPRGTEAITTTKKPKLRVSRTTMSESNKDSQSNGAPAEPVSDAAGQTVASDQTTGSDEQPATNGSPATTKRQSPRTTGRKSGRSTISSPIEQAVALKASLRQTLSETSELIRALKRQKKQSRMITTTLKSLKELQQAG